MTKSLEILQYIRDHPQKKQREVADHFGTTQQVVNYHLRKAGLTNPKSVRNERGNRKVTFSISLEKDQAEFFNKFPSKSYLIRKILSSYIDQYNKKNKASGGGY